MHSTYLPVAVAVVAVAILGVALGPAFALLMALACFAVFFHLRRVGRARPQIYAILGMWILGVVVVGPIMVSASHSRTMKVLVMPWSALPLLLWVSVRLQPLARYLPQETPPLRRLTRTPLGLMFVAAVVFALLLVTLLWVDEGRLTAFWAGFAVSASVPLGSLFGVLAWEVGFGARARHEERRSQRRAERAVRHGRVSSSA